MAAGDYAFGARVLDDGVTYFVTKCKPPASPVALSETALAKFEGSKVSDWTYQEHDCPIEMHVFGANAAATEAARDALIKDLYRGQQNLKLGYQDERYWLARLAGEPMITKKTNGVHMVEAKFRTVKSFAFANAASTATTGAAALAAVAGSEYKATLTPAPGGNIYNRPVFTITVPHAAAYGITSLWIVNVTAGAAQTIYVDRAYVVDDVLIVDCENLTTRVNGVAVDPGGSFPFLDPREGATNTVELHVLATSLPTLTFKADWTPRFAA